MRAFDRGEQVGDLAFGDPAADRRADHRAATLQRAGQRVEHPGGDVRHPGQDEQVGDADSRRARHAIGDQFGPLWHPRHAQPRLGQPAARFVIARHHRPRLRMDDHRHAQRGGDRIDGDVVMRRADPAGGEAIVIAGAQRIDRRDDPRLNIGNHAHFGKANALHVEPHGKLRDILVLGAARQDLVADHHKARGPDALVHESAFRGRGQVRQWR